MAEFSMNDDGTLRVGQDLVDLLVARAELSALVKAESISDYSRLMRSALTDLDAKIAQTFKDEGCADTRFVIERTHFAIAEVINARKRAWKTVSDMIVSTMPHDPDAV